MADQNQYVTVVNPYDVLFGRGSGPNDHEGNIRFRDLVAQRKAEYMATNHRQTKAKIAKAIVDTVFANNGRFLKKLDAKEVEKLGYSSGMDVYAIADDDTIMEKAKQALRQNRDKAVTTPTNPPNGNAGKETLDANMGMHMGMPPPLPRGTGGAMLPPGSQYPASAGQLDGGMINPMAAGNYKMDQAPIYTEDSEGYATYTTTLGDPEDDRLFPNRRQSASSQRRSFLGGRKDGGGPRNSMQMSDAWRRDSMMGGRGESMQMSELMESFKGMSTTGEMTSTDTIGTIEGDLYGKSQMSGLSNMSVVSISSGTSLFKPTNGSDSDVAKSDGAPGNVPSGVQVNPNEMGNVWSNQGQGHAQQMPSQDNANKRGSMISKDQWTSGNLNHLLRAPMDGSSTLLNMEGSSISGAYPRNVQLMEENPDSLNFLTTSSMSVLRAADQSSTSFRAGLNGSSSYDVNKGADGGVTPEQK